MVSMNASVTVAAVLSSPSYHIANPSIVLVEDRSMILVPPRQRVARPLRRTPNPEASTGAACWLSGQGRRSADATKGSNDTRELPAFRRVPAERVDGAGGGAARLCVGCDRCGAAEHGHGDLPAGRGAAVSHP